jgi:hypothetical protein
MARLYADEHFPRQVVQNLRSLGHDILTVQEAGNAGLPDEDVLAFATSENRAVLTESIQHTSPRIHPWRNKKPVSDTQAPEFIRGVNA